MRVKDDTGGGETYGSDASTRSLLLERVPALLRGAVVGARAFVSRWSGQLGRRGEAAPVSCGSGGAELFHVRRPKPRPSVAAAAAGPS